MAQQTGFDGYINKDAAGYLQSGFGADRDLEGGAKIRNGQYIPSYDGLASAEQKMPWEVYGPGHGTAGGVVGAGPSGAPQPPAPAPVAAPTAAPATFNASTQPAKDTGLGWLNAATTGATPAAAPAGNPYGSNLTTGAVLAPQTTAAWDAAQQVYSLAPTPSPSGGGFLNATASPAPASFSGAASNLAAAIPAAPRPQAQLTASDGSPIYATPERAAAAKAFADQRGPSYNGDAGAYFRDAAAAGFTADEIAAVWQYNVDDVKRSAQQYGVNLTSSPTGMTGSTPSAAMVNGVQAVNGAAAQPGTITASTQPTKASTLMASDGTTINATPEQAAQFKAWVAKNGPSFNEDAGALFRAARAAGFTVDQVATMGDYNVNDVRASAKQYGVDFGSTPASGTVAATANTPQGQYNLNQQVNTNATVEGRVNGLLATDAQGNYTNQVVRQAVDRATQAFASRGLQNSSLAAQAGQEAAISKAIEIAGPDAAALFAQSRANQDAQNANATLVQNRGYAVEDRNFNRGAAVEDRNFGRDASVSDRDAARAAAISDRDFGRAGAIEDRNYNRDTTAQATATANEVTLRQNYAAATAQIGNTYQNTVANINNSNMKPEDNSAAIAQASAVRDGELTYTNNLYAKQPGWKTEWLAEATPVQGVDVANINNSDTLANIANDPAQPESVRAQARAKLNGFLSSPAVATPTPNRVVTGWENDAISGGG